MKEKFIDAIRILVNSNIWIALATVCFYELSIIQIGQELKLNSSVFFLFFSTLFIYNFFRILGDDTSNRKWYVKNYNYTKVLSILSLVATGVSLYFFNKQFLPLIFIAGFLTILYVGPFTLNTNNKFNLRKFWFLKSIIVSVVWVLLTVILPLVETKQTGSLIFSYSLEKFFFILGITIPYDIKDLIKDESSGVKTLAMKFGISKTKWISNGFLSIGLLLAFFNTKEYFIAILFVYLVTMSLNYRLNEQKDELWYTFFVDGTIILYFVTIYFASLLSFF